MFQVPTAVYELAGQPVQQRLVGRQFSLRAQIVHDPGKTEAEELLPETVHDHARGQGVFTRHQPIRQIKAVQPPPVWRLIGTHQVCRQRRLEDFARLDQKVATRQHAHRSRLSVGDGHQTARNRGLKVVFGFVCVGKLLPRLRGLRCHALEMREKLFLLLLVAVIGGNQQNSGNFCRGRESYRRRQRVGIGGDSDAKMSERLVRVVLLQFQGQGLAGTQRERRGQSQHELVSLVGLGQDRPADCVAL